MQLDNERTGIATHQVQEYSSSLNEWTIKAPMITPRFRHDTAYAEGHVIIFGGASSSLCDNSVESDCTLRWGHLTFSIRCHHLGWWTQVLGAFEIFCLTIAARIGPKHLQWVQDRFDGLITETWRLLLLADSILQLREDCQAEQVSGITASWLRTHNKRIILLLF